MRQKYGFCLPIPPEVWLCLFKNLSGPASSEPSILSIRAGPILSWGWEVRGTHRVAHLAAPALTHSQAIMALSSHHPALLACSHRWPLPGRHQNGQRIFSQKSFFSQYYFSLVEQCFTRNVFSPSPHLILIMFCEVMLGVIDYR